MYQASFRCLWVVLAMCMVASLAAQSPPVDGLAVYYPFNGDATDETGYGDDGMVQGATLTTDRHGRAGSAFSFNYENLEFISARGYGHAVKGVPSRTYSIWFKQSPRITDNLLQAPLFTQFEGGTGAIFTVEFVGPNLRVFLLGNGSPAPYTASAGPNQPTTDGQWHQLVCIVETNGVSAYLDANTIVWDDGPRPPEREWILPGELGFYIGAGFNNGYQRYCYDGELDDLRVYRRALSIQEVRALYEFEQILPAFTLIAPTSDKFLIQWNQAAAGMKLQRTTSLAQPDWQTLSGSEDLNRLVLPIWSGNEFFRLVKP